MDFGESMEIKQPKAEKANFKPVLTLGLLASMALFGYALYTYNKAVSGIYHIGGKVYDTNKIFNREKPVNKDV